MSITVYVPARDYSVTVPERYTNTGWTVVTETLVDESGNILVDESAFILGADTTTFQNQYVITVPARDYSVTVPQES